jgi:flagella basal body P-ring formation protein FlgA
MIQRVLFWALAGGGMILAQCVQVSGERILARDLAQAVPVFNGLPAELSLGYAPPAGARRVYSHAELERLARRYGLKLPPQATACVTRRLETLTRQRVQEAVRQALPQAHIAVLEFSRQPVPAGDLQFPLCGLQAGYRSGAPLLWRGHVSQSGHDDFPVWAKVRMEISGQRAIAGEALPAGQPITRAQLRLETYQGSAPWPDISQIIGKAPRRPIPAGTPLRLELVEEAREVQQGQTVRVEVAIGRARLKLAGQAQSSGRRGDLIAVRNPATGKIFRARVAGRGEVWLAPGGGMP